MSIIIVSVGRDAAHLRYDRRTIAWTRRIDDTTWQVRILVPDRRTLHAPDRAHADQLMVHETREWVARRAMAQRAAAGAA